MNTSTTTSIVAGRVTADDMTRALRALSKALSSVD